jgi:energy-converting hydrogenase Eha subunit H
MNKARAKLAQAPELGAMLVLTLALVAAGHAVEGDIAAPDLFAGLAALAALVTIGYVVAAFMPGALPDLFWVSIVVILASLPGTPSAPLLSAALEPLSLTATMTPIMALAAIGVSAEQTRLFART